MKKRSWQSVRTCVLCALVAACGVGAALAEVSVVVVGDDCESALVTITMTIVEDADPVGWRAWTPYRDGPVEVSINTSGEPRGDLVPDLVFDPDACVVRLAWPYRTALGDYDIAFMDVVDGVPGPYNFLSAGLDSDLDPRIHVSENGTYVAWWTDGSAEDTVHLSRRGPGSITWDSALPVTGPGENGRRPSVATHDGMVLVAYETDSAQEGMLADVVVAAIDAGGNVTRQVVARTAYAGRLDPMLHVAQGRFWLDWRHGTDAFAYSTFESSGWSAPVTFPWSDATWLGLESARSAIRSSILMGSSQAPPEE